MPCSLDRQVTARKIRMAPVGAETYKVLLEFMAPESIPVEYGGKLRHREATDGVRWVTAREKSRPEGPLVEASVRKETDMQSW